MKKPIARLIRTSPVVIRGVPLLMLLTLSMSLTACKTVKVVSADQMETRVEAGKPFTPTVDGWFMGDARYQRYRRAVSDKILELKKATPNG